jgi:hypothetical protein
MALFGGWAVGQIEQAPYNVRELFAEHGAWVGLVIWLSLALLGSIAWWLARLSSSSPGWSARLLLPVIIAATSAVYVLLAAIVPLESLGDVLGSPVLEIPQRLEWWARFVGLAAAPVLAWTVGIRAAFQGLRRRDFVLATSWLSGIALSYTTVVLAACTDNIVELLPDDGRSWRVVGIVGWLALTSFSAACWVRSLTSKSLLVSVPLTSMIVLLSVIPGWYCVKLGLNPRLDKYDSTFSALQFLLSPDRSHYVSGDRLFWRFSVLHYLIVGYLAVTGFIVEAWLPALSLSAKTPSAGPRRSAVPQ